jgi:hypothetical protein
MYFQRLYKHHKGWFAFVVAFALAQLFICVRRGIVCTPFYQYGMYSAVERTTDILAPHNILADGRNLLPDRFSASDWDKVVEPLNRFADDNQWNHQIWSVNIQRLLGVRDSVPYLNADLTSEQFIVWYKEYLSVILHKRINHIDINYLNIRWADSGN